MYKINARDGRDMVSTRRLFSKRLTNALRSEKCSKMRVLMFPKVGPRLKCVLVFGHLLG